MGQYYVIANIDKKEKISPLTGVKLMEFGWFGDRIVEALCGMMRGRWRGDRVYVVGDYADRRKEGQPEENWHGAVEAALDELGYGEDESLYAIAKEDFKDVTGEALEAAIEECWWGDPRYLVNEAERVFVDLEGCPVDHVSVDGRGRVEHESIHPLPLLLAMGNGQGGGDYFGVNAEAVGSWVKDAARVRILLEGEGEKLAGYRRVDPGFVETRERDEVEARIEAIRKALANL